MKTFRLNITVNQVKESEQFTIDDIDVWEMQDSRVDSDGTFYGSGVDSVINTAKFQSVATEVAEKIWDRLGRFVEITISKGLEGYKSKTFTKDDYDKHMREVAEYKASKSA